MATPECSDGIDDDGDGATDYPDDLGCTSAGDVDESACGDGVCEGGETCTSCDSDCPCAACADGDGDGYGSSAAGCAHAEVDCDDADADVHPGASEACNDVDGDCSGAADEGRVAGGEDIPSGDVTSAGCACTSRRDGAIGWWLVGVLPVRSARRRARSPP